jgi:N4-(beta-N-acetylglucosaminyl)-L-asparaginase
VEVSVNHTLTGMETPVSRGGRPPLSSPPFSASSAAAPAPAFASPTYASLPGDDALLEAEGEPPPRELPGVCAPCERLPAWARVSLLALLVFAVLGAFVGLLFGGGGGGGGDGDGGGPGGGRTLPVAVNTWFATSTTAAYALLANGSSALDAAELGCQACEDARCDGTVGWGGSPDSTGETTLDALIMDGASHDVGAVGDLRRVRHAIAAARKVLHYSSHTLLAGEGATNFSLMMGLPEQDLHSQESVWSYGNWSRTTGCTPPPNPSGCCQSNFFLNVVGQNTTCPPYVPIPTPTYTPVARAAARAAARAGEAARGSAARAAAAATTAAAAAAATHIAAPPPGRRRPVPASERDHDTVGMCTLDVSGSLAVGVSSNGANHKIAGRIGDAPIVGAGGYASNEAGCAAATGDGDITMRFLPAYQAVENMRRGMAPDAACDDAVRRIARYYPSFELGLVCLAANGQVGAASHGWTFTYCAASPDTQGAAVCTHVPPMDGALPPTAAPPGGALDGARAFARKALASARAWIWRGV